MDPDYYDKLHVAQERHWWYATRRKIFDTLLADAQESGLPEGTVYDLGCGVGANLAMLARFGNVVGVDTHPRAVEFCKSRGFENVMLGDLSDLHQEAPSDSASIVMLTDVIEHLADERPCLEAAARMLKPGGILLVTVPAYMFLWGPSDEVNHHYRRYVERDLVELVGRYLPVTRSSYFNTLLFGAAVVGRKMEDFLGRAGTDLAHVPPEPLNSILRAVFMAEVPILRRGRFDFGVSILCVARKPR